MDQSKRLEIRLSSNLKERLERIAREKGISVSDLVREILESFLEVYSGEANIKELIKEALKNPVEAKYILQLDSWYRQGEAFTDYCKHELIHGEADDIILEEIDEGYPYRIIKRHIIIPRTIPVVVLRTCYDDEFGPGKEVHVFTKDGWKKVDVE